jgi:hypothetical protein
MLTCINQVHKPGQEDVKKSPSFNGSYWNASPEDQRKEQDIFWSIYESTTAINAAPVINVAPHVRPWWTRDGPVMTEKISKGLKEMKGGSLVFVMGRFIWEVHDKAYGYDFCLFFKGGHKCFPALSTTGPQARWHHEHMAVSRYAAWTLFRDGRNFP